VVKTSSKGISLEAMHSDTLELKTTVSSKWDNLLGLEYKLQKVQNEYVKLKQENGRLKSLLHTEYFRTDDFD